MRELYELIFAAPWWLPMLLGLFAIVLLWSGNRNQNRGMKAAGMAVVGIGLTIILLSALFETALETVDRQTREMIIAVDEHDWPAVSQLLHPRAGMNVLNAPVSINSPEEIVPIASAAAEQYGLRSARIRTMRLEQANGLITVHLEAVSEQDATPYPLPSSWQLDWHQTADGWFLYRLTLIQIGRRTGEEVGQHVPRQ